MDGVFQHGTPGLVQRMGLPEQETVVPVSDQCEHFYMALYFLFGSCTSPRPIPMQCEYTTRWDELEGMNCYWQDQTLSNVQQKVGYNVHHE